MVRLTDRLELRLYRDKLNVSVQIDTIIYAETCQSIEADFYIEGGGINKIYFLINSAK